MFLLKRGSVAPHRSLVALPPLSTVFSLILHMRISKATPTWVFQLLEEVRSMLDKKRHRSGPGDELFTASGKHRLGYSASWETEFPWLVPVREGREVTGLICSLCKRHKRMQRSGSRIWIENPCKLLRKDMIQRHRSSQMQRRLRNWKVLAFQQKGMEE